MIASLVALRAWANKSLEDNNFITFVMAVLLLVGFWKILEKAGVEGWRGIIPIYKYYVLFDVTAGSGVLFITMLVPLVGECLLGYYTAKAYGKSKGFMIGLMLLPSVFYPILGFSDSRYYGPKGVNDYRTKEAKEAKTVAFETVVDNKEEEN